VFEARTGRLVGVGTNGVLRLNNSSAHAEIVALMMAQSKLRSFTLQADGMPAHELFSSCEPCAMCLGATLWSGVIRLVFAATREDATATELRRRSGISPNRTGISSSGASRSNADDFVPKRARYSISISNAAGPIYNG
jgi:tRNA(Arg) A34 adenosine deaminase TadA